MHANGGDVKGLQVRNAGDGELESNFAIRMRENATICKAYFDRGAGLNNKAQIGNQCFMDKIQCSTGVNKSLNRLERPISETDK
jgi:hypothetical protein